MAGKAELQKKLRAGIEAAQQGDKRTARNLLKQVLSEDENNELAWMWLASAVETLEERRTCLQKTLQINPNNTRAREALNRLSGQPSGRAEQDRRAVEGLRRMERQQRTTPAADGQRPNTSTIIVAAVVVLAVIAVLIFGGALAQQATVGGGATPNVEAIFNPTSTNTIDPDTFTATPVRGVIVTFSGNEQSVFPPTFTPTPPATATITLTPSETPYPLASFTLIYSARNPGEARPGLFRMNGEGAAEEELATGELGFDDVAFDPTGERIAFIRTVTFTNVDGVEITAPELFIAPVNDLAAARQLTELEGDIMSGPTWALDGIQLMFSSNSDGDEEIYYITEDSNNLRQITFNDNVIDRDPTWAPDDSRILFASDLDSPGLTEIYTMTLAGEEITRLTNDTGSSYDPRFSQDGTRVTFVSDRGGDGDIYVMDPDGQRPFLLTVDDAGAEDRSPAFTPDGQWVTFASNRDGDMFQVYVVDLRGNVLRRLTTNERDTESLDYRPEFLLRVR